MAAITYKCPNCDGGLVFDPSSQKYHCEYCLSDFTQEELECLSQELVRRKAEHQEPGLQGQDSREQERREPGSAGAQPVLYTCPSCGAQIVTDETTAATFCYYCHNPVVLAGRLEGQFRPDYVIPFQIDRQKAEEIFSQWIGRKKYVPETFYNKKQIESMSGVYFPYWLYSCRVDGELDAQGTRLRTWDTAGMRYTETTVYDVKRQGTMEVDHVARNGLRKANRQLVDSVLPYRMNEKEDFSMGYLSGLWKKNSLCWTCRQRSGSLPFKASRTRPGATAVCRYAKRKQAYGMKNGVMPCFLYGPLHIMTRPGERYTISLSTGRPEKSAESCLWTGRRL